MKTISLPVGAFPADLDSSRTVVIASITDAFQRAHYALLDKYPSVRNIQGNDISPTMKQWWKEEYNVVILGDWFAAQFESQQDYLLFILRWS